MPAARQREGIWQNKSAERAMCSHRLAKHHAWRSTALSSRCLDWCEASAVDASVSRNRHPITGS
eukprot:804735-Prymnesium_polylepis.1